MKSISFAALCLLGLVKADQPVHCIRDKLFGEWYFHVASQDTTVNLYQTRELCTHKVPNKIQLVNDQHKFFFEKEDVYKINLLEDFKAEAVICRNTGGLKANEKPSNCEKTLIKGRWTAVYDQALNIELDNGQRFLANLRYNLKHEIAADPLAAAQKAGGVTEFNTIETSDYDKFDSDCGRTMVGFVQNIPSITGKSHTLSQHTVNCFHGYQVERYGFEESEAHDNGKLKWNAVTQHKKDIKTEDLLAQAGEKTTTDTKAARPRTQHGVGEQTKNGLRKSLVENGSGHAKNAMIKGERAKKRQNMHQAHRPSDEMDLLIEAVNEAGLGWTADVCKYQKTHPKHGGDKCEEKSALLAQLTSGTMELGFFDDFNVDELTTALQGLDADDKNKFGEAGDKKFEAALTKAQKYMKQYNGPDDIPDSEMPETLDFRDIDGYDFTSYFRDQGRCGSCYTISMTQVMEARLKLKYGKQPPMLSPQMLMTCNYMNEGCDGGWPHFNILLGENGHLVTEKCAPYKQSTKGASCSAFSKCAPIAKVEKSYQIGGGWGATTERKMMKEILRNGPINGDFQAPKIFSLYKEGIFSEKGLLDIHRKQQEMLQLAQISRSDQSMAESAEAADINSISDKTLNDKNVSWVEMNHSVVIIGWGKDKESNAKYWIVRNSYGPNWGMNGDFYVKRGSNDFGMEVENMAFTAIQCAEDSTDDVCKPVQQ